jgi:hypothetical protein
VEPDAYLTDVQHEFRRLKALADGALVQIDDVGFFHRPHGEANGIAVLVKHIAGNQHSRWRDFRTTDGEKPDRDRDSEFVVDASETRAELLAHWEAGWSLLFEALDGLGPDDLVATVTIRSEPHSVLQAIQRQLTHYAYHVGQIVHQARALSGPAWKSLSVPTGGSVRFHEDLESDLAG